MTVPLGIAYGTGNIAADLSRMDHCVKGKTITNAPCTDPTPLRPQQDPLPEQVSALVTTLQHP